MTTVDSRSGDWALLDQYLAGSCTPEVRTQIEVRLAAEPAFGALYEALRGAVRGAPTPTASVVEDDERAWTRMYEAVRARPQVAARRSAMGRRPIVWQGKERFWNKSLRTALVGAFASIVLIFAWSFRHSSSLPTSRQHYQTSLGQRLAVQLADHSAMMLAPMTRVDVEGDGTMTLHGEAYFQISPHSTRSVVVRTTNAIVRVLGTKFSVRHYAGDANSRIVVEDGRVSLQSVASAMRRGTPVVLSARMMGLIADSAIQTTSNIPIDAYMAWTRGQLVFNGTPLRDVVEEVSRAYGAKLRIADTLLAHQPMTLTVSVMAEPLPKVLEIIALAYHAHFTRVGEDWVLVRGRQPATLPRARESLNPEKEYGK